MIMSKAFQPDISLFSRVYLKPNSKLPPPPSLFPVPCRQCATSKPKENVKAYCLPWSNIVGAVCRHPLMRLDKYRDNFLSCRLLIAVFLLFAVRTWRLQRHRGGEWLKLLHYKGGMWVMCTENCCTAQEVWPAPASFWHKGWTRGCVLYI